MSTPNPRPAKVYRCRFCKVQVISPSDTHAVFGKVHGKHCPRRFK